MMIEIRSGLCVMGGLTGKGLQEVFWVMKIFFVGLGSSYRKTGYMLS